MSELAGERGSRGALSWLAIVLSVVAIGCSVAALGRSAGEAGSGVDADSAAHAATYDAIVAEVWSMTQPVYEDFGIARSTPPSTLEETLGPLIAPATAGEVQDE